MSKLFKIWEPLSAQSRSMMSLIVFFTPLADMSLLDFMSCGKYGVMSMKIQIVMERAIGLVVPSALPESLNYAVPVRTICWRILTTSFFGFLTNKIEWSLSSRNGTSVCASVIP